LSLPDRSCLEQGFFSFSLFQSEKISGYLKNNALIFSKQHYEHHSTFYYNNYYKNNSKTIILIFRKKLFCWTAQRSARKTATSLSPEAYYA